MKNPSFSRCDLLATLVMLSVLLLVTAGMMHTDFANVAACQNNLRRLGLALLEYADDNAGAFPPRTANPSWPERLRPYYKEISILICPSDGPIPFSMGIATNAADAAPRSYIFNGWNDYFLAHGLPSVSTQPFPQSAINEPAQTILFGEKVTDSAHYWFDYAQLDDISQLEQGRHHRSGASSAFGASNHAFADGSVRPLKWGAAFNPINLWVVEPEWRTNSF